MYTSLPTHNLFHSTGTTCRAEVRLMVQNTVAAATAYGPYVQPVSVNSDTNPDVLAKMLRGVKCLICLGRLGKLLPAAKKAGVQHILLLSSAGGCESHGLFRIIINCSTTSATTILMLY